MSGFLNEWTVGLPELSQKVTQCLEISLQSEQALAPRFPQSDEQDNYRTKDNGPRVRVGKRVGKKGGKSQAFKNLPRVGA